MSLLDLIDECATHGIFLWDTETSTKDEFVAHFSDLTRERQEQIVNRLASQLLQLETQREWAREFFADSVFLDAYSHKQVE